MIAVISQIISPTPTNALQIDQPIQADVRQSTKTSESVNNTFEFPMIGGVSANPLVVNNIGLDFKQDLKTKVSIYGAKQADALEVMTAAGWK